MILSLPTIETKSPYRTGVIMDEGPPSGSRTEEAFLGFVG